MVRVLRPLDLFGLARDRLELHRELAAADFVVRERLELRGEAEQRRSANEELGRVPLVELGRVPVVLRELVVEVVVTLADGDERGDPVVLRRMLVVERCLTEPMSERVDAEGRVVDEQQASGAGEEEAAAPVAPSEAGDDRREDEAHADDQGQVPAVLPLDDRVDGKVANVRDTGAATRLDDHPADVRPPETLRGRVRVEVGVGVTVVSTVTTGPPLCG